MGDIAVGTCGYTYYDAPDGWQDTYESKLAAYADAHGCVELNRTFYSLPQVSTAERWRREADSVDESFTFLLKGWQALTHPISSPTWRDYEDELEEEQRDDVGYLQPNSTVLAAWRETNRRATALRAPVVLIQTPPSFDCTDEHATTLRAFVEHIDRDGVELAWEPRGTWLEHPDRVEALCTELGLIHVTDLLRELPTATTEIAYTRLHGLNDDRYDYDYKYEERELDELADRLETLAADHQRTFCLFNNYAMDRDAAALSQRLD
ncbi:MAG: DUF72 domain-containing protein [Salinirussus sp.]